MEIKCKDSLLTTWALNLAVKCCLIQTSKGTRNWLKLKWSSRHQSMACLTREVDPKGNWTQSTVYSHRETQPGRNKQTNTKRRVCLTSLWCKYSVWHTTLMMGRHTRYTARASMKYHRTISEIFTKLTVFATCINMCGHVSTHLHMCINTQIQFPQVYYQLYLLMKFSGYFNFSDEWSQLWNEG